MIVAGGLVSGDRTIQRFLQRAKRIIAADGGAARCLRLGITPDVVIGDFDSIDERALREVEAAGVELIRHPADKDATDLELALDHAREIGAKALTVLGAVGSRWDQSLASILLLASDRYAQMTLSIFDPPQRLFILRPGARLSISGAIGDVVSLIPLGARAEGLSTTGLKYPLDGQALDFATTRGVSNVLLQATASVRLSKGLLIITHAPDPTRAPTEPIQAWL